MNAYHEHRDRLIDDIRYEDEFHPLGCLCEGCEPPQRWPDYGPEFS